MRVVAGAFVVLLVGCATAPSTRDAADPDKEARAVAEAYLNAISGKGDEAGYAVLLGGATANARLFALENWRILSDDAPRHEEADLEAAEKLVAELDDASRTAMADLMRSTTSDGSQSIEQLTPEVALQLMGPTQATAGRLTASFPLLSEALGVGKGIYWNPKNPARTLVTTARSGQYQLDLRGFEIETTEGPRKVARRWHLKVLRFLAPQLDTGWKVLPASDWNAD